MVRRYFSATFALAFLFAVSTVSAYAGCAEDIKKVEGDKVFVAEEKALAHEKLNKLIGKAKKLLASGKHKKCGKVIAKAQTIIENKR